MQNWRAWRVQFAKSKDGRLVVLSVDNQGDYIMKMINERGNITVNILLIIMLVIIAVLIYILAGGPLPNFAKTGGVNSPVAPTPDTTQLFSQTGGKFSDGLINPEFSEQYQLDEFGAGISERDIFDRDINADGVNDRITRTRNENGTAHFYYEYKIELNKNGDFIDITPDGFRTTEGAECALTKLQFAFKPEFRVIKISRDWQDSWDTPTMATRTVYTIENDEIIQIESKPLKSVCNVADLF